jgi:hypothetical protein
MYRAAEAKGCDETFQGNPVMAGLRGNTEALGSKESQAREQNRVVRGLEPGRVRHRSDLGVLKFLDR